MVRYNYAFWSNIIIFRSNLPCGLLGPDTTCQYFVHLMEYDLLKELMEWTWIKQWWFRHYILLYLFISDIQSFHVGRAEFYQWTLQPSCCNSAKLDQSWSSDQLVNFDTYLHSAIIRSRCHSQFARGAKHVEVGHCWMNPFSSLCPFLLLCPSCQQGTTVSRWTLNPPRYFWYKLCFNLNLASVSQ